MLDFIIDNIFVLFSGWVLMHDNGILYNTGVGMVTTVISPNVIRVWYD
jgi:hypothetical protein